MTLSPRAHLLHTFDAHCRAFEAATAERFVLSAQHASAEIEALAELAGRVAGDLVAWRSLVSPLDVAHAAPFDLRRAGRMIMESVFDEVLTPDAWRVLTAALELTQG